MRRRQHSKRAWIAIFLSLMTTAAHATTWQVDGAQSTAQFALRGPWLAQIEGRFAHIDGRVTSQHDATHYDVSIRIAAASVLMRRDSYENWAKSAEFFDVERHPWIEFEALAVPHTLLLAGGELHGALQMRGTQRPVVLHLQAADCAAPARDCPVRATAKIDRGDFGMQARRVLIGEHVRLHFEFLLKPDAAHRESK